MYPFACRFDFWPDFGERRGATGRQKHNRINRVEALVDILLEIEFSVALVGNKAQALICEVNGKLSSVVVLVAQGNVFCEVLL